MHRKQRYKRNVITLSFIIALIGIFSLTSIGCEPLRKKFTRKKKKEKKEKFIPVLDPIDYPTRNVTPQERYHHHYNLWKIWHRELKQTVDGEGPNSKRMNYQFAQTLTQLMEMEQYVKGTTHDQLLESINDMNRVQKRIKKPENMRNMVSIRRKLDSISKEIRLKFNPRLEIEYVD